MVVDQAAELRRMLSGETGDKIARYVAFTSGKGGVGKTNVALNTAIILGRMGKTVLLVDADLGLANVNILMGTYYPRTIEHLIRGEASVDDVVYPYVDSPNVFVLPGCSGVTDIVDQMWDKVSEVASGLEALSSKFDFVIIDTGAGINRVVRAFVLAASEAVIVSTPEVSSITDAYAMIKAIHDDGFLGRFYVLVNMAKNEAEGRKTYMAISGTAKSFLGLDAQLLGVIPWDKSVRQAVLNQRPVVMAYPSSPFSRSIERVAQRLIAGVTASPLEERRGFWKRLFGILSSRRD